MIDIKLNNELKTLKFSNRGLEAYTKLTGADIGSVKEISDDYTQLDMVRDLIYCGLVGFARSQNKAIDFTIDDVNTWVDDLPINDQLAVIKEFTASCLKMTNEMLDALKAMSSESDEKKK